MPDTCAEVDKSGVSEGARHLAWNTEAPVTVVTNVTRPDTSDRDRQPDPRIAQAVELLASVARERLAKHPQSHLVEGLDDHLELAFPLGLAAGTARAAEAQGHRSAEVLERGLAEGVAGLVHHRSAFRPGRVYCLRCASSECEHSELPSARSTFAGFGPTGIPRFLDFGQWLLESRDPRVDELYGDTPRVVAVIAPEDELTGQLLPAYRDAQGNFRILGQVTAGWYRLPDAQGHRRPVAVTFQIVSSERPSTEDGQDRGRQRLGLNLLVSGPGGEPAEHLYDRLGEIPWGETARWAQGAVSSVGQALTGKRKPSPEQLERRLQGLLAGLARRLEKKRRARQRRTDHAQERHTSGDRPTRMALADLARSKDVDVLRDERRDTFVVLGEKGRAHVFSPQGKLVTSVRYSLPSIERRRERGDWKPASFQEVKLLRERIEGSQATAERR